MPQTKAILFDFMGVLLFAKDDYSASDASEEIDRIIGKVTDDVIFKKETLESLNLNEEEFTKILSTIVNKYERFKPLWDLLPGLRTQYQLAIINNGTALTLDALKKEHGIEENFNLFVSSAIEGIRKPDERIFLITAERLGVFPEECLFMDDSKQNTEGAAKTGMQTIHWENREQGFNDFQSWLQQERFAELRHATLIASAGSSIRLAGSKLSDDEVEQISKSSEQK